MQKIFQPAVALLNRLNYTKKFTLLWLMSSVAIAVVMYGLLASLDRVIQPSKLELQGLVLIEPVSRSVQSLQLHRGLSAALLGGTGAVRDRRAAQEAAVAEAFGAMEKALPPGLTAGEDFRNIKAGWEKLRKEGFHWTADENFAAHIRLIEQIQSLESSIADKYALILDAELDTYYLIDTSANKLPHVFEHLGQLRAYGTGILAKKQISEPQKAKLNALTAELDSTLREFRGNIEKTGRYNPAVREPLLTAANSIVASARQIAGIVAADILTGRFATPPEAFLEAATAEIDRSYAQLHEIMLPTTKMLIEARIARAKNTLFVSIGSALLLLLLVIYISISIYYAIIGSVRSLVHSAHTFAEGDLDQRVRLGTRDELSQIGDSFNRMADGFSALLEERKRAEGLLQSVIENAPVHIFWKDRDSRYLGCNTRFAKGAGYSAPDELAGKTDFDLGWKDYAESFRADDKAVMESGTPKLNYEEPFTTPDGNLAWARTSKVPLRDESNRVIGILGIYEDVTIRKQAEQELMESRRRAQLYLDTAGVMLIALDARGRVQMVNRKGCEMLGYSEAEILGKDWFDNFLPEPARKEVRKVFTKIMGGNGAPVEYFENDILTAGGDVLTVAWHNSPLLDESGKISGVLSSGEDITERKKAEGALRESEERFHAYVEAASDALFVHDSSGRLSDVNWRACASLGYTREELLSMSVFDVETDFDLAQAKAAWAQIRPGQPFTLLGHHRRKDGTTFPVEIQFGCFDLKGKRYYMGLVRDITERKRAERVLAESQERLRAVIETALDAVVQMDAEGFVTGWNAQAEKIFGWTREEAVGRLMHETIIPQQYREAHKQGLKRFLAAGEGAILNTRVELMGLHRDGHEFPIELAVVPIKTSAETSGKTVDKYEFSAFIHDITSRKKAEGLIWKQANFDTLTGLPNRHMFYDRLAQEIKKAERTGLPMALLYIDLDRFKEINDTLGHSMGDILLVETTRRISACVREADTVGRLGGDEFIIILTELNEVRRIDALAQNILHELAEPFRLENEVVYLSASIGITLYPHDAAGMEDLVKNADQAMYTAKDKGRNRFSYFTQYMQQAAQTKLRLVNNLRGALAASQFRVYYQPILELATGRIHKAEALIRWQHPVRGLVSPAEFIPLAEETGLILEIGDWVFRESVRQVKLWREQYGPEFQISVNMSPIQFQSDDSPCRTWPAYLQKLGLPGQSLILEITEGLLLKEDTGVKDRLLRFHETGLQISLDDFGTGYSSLSYLQKFDIDYLKIDQSFTRGLETGSSNMALSEAIIVMAHRLGIEVIAEGVETEAQRTLLAAAGCDYGQGYLFSRPVPAEEFEELLKGAVTRGSQTQ